MRKKKIYASHLNGQFKMRNLFLSHNKPVLWFKLMTDQVEKKMFRKSDIISWNCRGLSFLKKKEKNVYRWLKIGASGNEVLLGRLNSVYSSFPWQINLACLALYRVGTVFCKVRGSGMLQKVITFSHNHIN